MDLEIHLFDTYVAGTTYISNISNIEEYLKIDEKIYFIREPENEYDNSAIRLETSYGAKIGYIPKRDNIIINRLMDSGKSLFGEVSSKNYEGTWLRINIKVFLSEHIGD